MNLTPENSFSHRLMRVLGGSYDPLMRRSVQSAILFQANSDVEKQFPALKIFKRKVLLFEAANKIADSLTEIPIEYRSKFLVRTCTAAVPLSPELAWRRLMFTKRESEKTLTQIQPFFSPTKTHDDVCDEFVQAEYVKKHNITENIKHPFNWEFSHLKEFIIYRLFYNGPILQVYTSPASDITTHNLTNTIQASPSPVTKFCDASLPSSNEKRAKEEEEEEEEKGVEIEKSKPPAQSAQAQNDTPHPIPSESIISRTDNMHTPEQRRSMLQEIREHLDILKEFEGVIPPEELKIKKRELFLSLPTVPRTPSSKDDELYSSRLSSVPQDHSYLGSSNHTSMTKSESKSETFERKRDRDDVLGNQKRRKIEETDEDCAITNEENEIEVDVTT